MFNITFKIQIICTCIVQVYVFIKVIHKIYFFNVLNTFLLYFSQISYYDLYTLKLYVIYFYQRIANIVFVLVNKHINNKIVSLI